MKILCTCKHEAQDKINGKGVRVATPINKNIQNKQNPKYRCTVCLKGHDKLIDE